MKKIVTLAVLAIAILANISYLSADEDKDNKPVESSTSVKSGFSNPLAGITSKLAIPSFASFQEFATDNPKTTGCITLGVVVAVMYKYCSWFRELIGVETKKPRRPRLNTRTTSPSRTY